MDKGTVLDYPGCRPSDYFTGKNGHFGNGLSDRGLPGLTVKMLLSDRSTLKSAISVGTQHLSWASTDTAFRSRPKGTH